MMSVILLPAVYYLLRVCGAAAECLLSAIYCRAGWCLAVLLSCRLLLAVLLLYYLVVLLSCFLVVFLSCCLDVLLSIDCCLLPAVRYLSYLPSTV
jgi:hypothetical protein